jgi:hypothetical protein
MPETLWFHNGKYGKLFLTNMKHKINLMSVSNKLKTILKSISIFTYFLAGQQIVNDYTHKVVIKEDGTQSLIIVPATPSDSGEWTVVAQNRAGRSSISVILTVEGKVK